MTCPECEKNNKVMFDLSNPTIVGDLSNIEQDIIRKVEAGKYITKMPLSKFNVEFRLMNGEDELILTEILKDTSRESEENLLTTQFKRLIMSIEGHSEQHIIDQYVENMPVVDSRHFKICLKATTPNIEIKQNFLCYNCGFEKEVDVPFGANFFWPDL